jgi:hypothetical protein
MREVIPLIVLFVKMSVTDMFTPACLQIKCEGLPRRGELPPSRKKSESAVNHTGVSEQQVGNDVTNKKHPFRHACRDLGPDNFLNHSKVNLAFLSMRKRAFNSI